MRPRVVAIDVGSVRNNFAWAALDLPGRRPVGEGGSHPEGAALAVLDALGAGLPVALGFEAPLMVPVSPVGPVDAWRTLGQARQGEAVDGRSRPWSAGAGSSALATGLVQMAWVLERVGLRGPRTAVYDPARALAGRQRRAVRVGGLRLRHRRARARGDHPARS